MQNGKNITIISGYPRSRSAWLSVLFDVNGIKSYHEPFAKNWPNYCSDWKGFEIDSEPVVLCDSSAPRFFNEIMHQWPLAKWIFVIRQESEVRESLKCLFHNQKSAVDVAMNEISETLSKCMESVSCIFRCDYYDLGIADSVRALWDSIQTGILFDSDRYHRLNGMKIEAIDYSGEIEASISCVGGVNIRRIA